MTSIEAAEEPSGPEPERLKRPWRPGRPINPTGTLPFKIGALSSPALPDLPSGNQMIPVGDIPDVTVGEEGVMPDDPVKQYLREIREYPLLSAAEEVDLAKKMQAGWDAEARLTAPGVEPSAADTILVEAANEARKHFTNCNLRLVVSIAKRYVGLGLPLLDIIQEGNIGLMRGVEKFDHTKGFKFSTYATWWIRQTVTRALADQSRTIRLPVHVGEALVRINRTRRDLTVELGREPTFDEIGAKLNIPGGKIEEIILAAQDPLSLEQPVGEDGDTTRADFVPDESGLSPDENSQREALKQLVDNVLNTLSAREKLVLQLRYGLTDGIDRTLEETAKEFNLTRERIRQIEAKGLGKLRHPSRAARLRAFTDKPSSS